MPHNDFLFSPQNPLSKKKIEPHTNIDNWDACFLMCLWHLPNQMKNKFFNVVWHIAFNLTCFSIDFNFFCIHVINALFLVFGFFSIFLMFMILVTFPSLIPKISSIWVAGYIRQPLTHPKFTIFISNFLCNFLKS